MADGLFGIFLRDPCLLDVLKQSSFTWLVRWLFTSENRYDQQNGHASWVEGVPHSKVWPRQMIHTSAIGLDLLRLEIIM